MQVMFEPSNSAQKQIVSEAAVAFHDGVFRGMVLRGFRIWRTAAGALDVVFPSASPRLGPGRQAMDLFRPLDYTNDAPVRRIKEWILAAYAKHRPSEDHA